MSESLVLKVVKPISIILLDLQMPRKSGIQVMTETKEFFRNLNNLADDGVEILEPRIVLLTSYLTPGLRQHIKSLGCNYCYDKPLQLE
jgi:CheY-like chemotaxis protein